LKDLGKIDPTPTQFGLPESPQTTRLLDLDLGWDFPFPALISPGGPDASPLN
jgi:hypothetical protein